MFLPDQFSFYSPVKTCCGKKALEMIPNEIAAMGGTRAMVLCSRRAEQKGWDRLLQKGFQGAGIPLGFCYDIPDAPDTVTIQTLRDMYLDRDFDVIIGLGGGGVMDTAKTVNLLVSEGAEDCFRFVGDGTITRPLKPLVAVLSPEGNGYESSGFAHLAGYTLFSHHLAPHVAVIDDRIASFENPAALLSMVLFALGGAVDAFIGGKKNPLIDAYAGACIHQVVETLKGGRLPGRKDHSSHNALMGAVNLGAGALSNSGKGHLHRLGEVMAACTAIPAGIIMGLLLPSALHHEAEKGNPHLGELLLPAAGFDTYAETAENDRPGRAVTVFAEWVEVLYAENARNLPTSLAEAGLNRNALPMIRDAAVKTGVPPADMEELMELVALACDTPSEAT